MVEVSLVDGTVRFEVQGADRLLGLKNRVEVPAEHIKSVRRETNFPTFWAGLRAPGAEVPGVLRIGSYYHHGAWTYWDLHWSHRDSVITVETDLHRYQRLIIEVPDPDAAIAAIESVRTAV